MITEATVRLSTEPQQAIKLSRLLVKLVTNKLSIILYNWCLDVITQSADDIFPTKLVTMLSNFSQGFHESIDWRHAGH